MYRIVIVAQIENTKKTAEMQQVIENHFGKNHYSFEGNLMVFTSQKKARFSMFNARHYSNILNQLASATFGFAVSPAFIQKKVNGKWTAA